MASVSSAAIAGRHLELAGLPFDAFLKLATSAARQPLSSKTATRLWEHTAGNPLHTWALLAEFTVDELITANDPLPTPRFFAESVIRRLARCSPETQELLRAAAVLGRTSTVSEVKLIAAVDRSLDAIAEAIDAGLLEPCRQAASEVCYTHAVIHSTVYHRLSATDRVRLHTTAPVSRPRLTQVSAIESLPRPVRTLTSPTT